MPFGQTTEEHTKEYWIDHFTHFIKPTIEGATDGQTLLGYQAKLADPSDAGIIGDVFKNLQEADVVVADLTDFNPNVMYELGIRHCLNDRTIMILEKGQEIPFYFKNYKIIEYSSATPRTTNDFKENIQRRLLNLTQQASNLSDNPVADYFQRVGQRVKVVANPVSDRSLQGTRESGFTAIYVPSTNTRRNTRKEEVVLNARKYIKLLASTGHAYLAMVGNHFKGAMIQRLEAHIPVQIVLLNPWSETRVLHVLGELSDGTGPLAQQQATLTPLQRDALEKLEQGNLADFDPVALIEQSVYYRYKYPESIQGYLDVSKQFGELIELRFCTHAVPATTLLTESTGFFEPYIHVNLRERMLKSMITFEIEFPSSNYFYRHCAAYFDTLWKLSIPYEKFVEKEEIWKAQLRGKYESKIESSGSAT